MNRSLARSVIALGTVWICACGAPPRSTPARVPLTVLARASTEPEPDPVAATRPRDPPSYRETLARELPAPSLARRDLVGSDRLHFVLDAGRCYRLVIVADDSVSVSFHDARGQTLARAAGRVVRLSGICPRWTGSFELRLEGGGSRGRAALYFEDDASR